MDPAAAQQMLNGAPTPSPDSLAPISNLAPKTAQAVQQTQTAAPDAPPDVSAAPPSIQTAVGMESAMQGAYKAQNQEPGVPFDVTSGIDSWNRMMLSFRRAQEDQVNFLENKYGKGSVRLSSDGVPIVRVLDSETGKPKDLRATELGMSLKDFLDLAGQVPEIAGGILAARKGNVKGIWPAIKNIGRVALGSEGAGALKDIAVEAMDSGKVRPGEIAEDRAKMAVGDVAAGAALGVLGKAGVTAISPFPGRNLPAIQFDLKEAQDYFAKKGFTLPATIGEETGNTFLLRSEAFSKQNPGSSAPFDKIVKQQTAELAKIQNVARGLPPQATDAEIAARPSPAETGAKAMGAIEDKLAPIKQGIAGAKETLPQTGSESLAKVTQQVVGRGPMDVPTLSQAMRESAAAKRASFQAQSAADYGKVYSHPLANEYALSSDSLAEKASSMLKEMPAPETISETPTGILDEYGNEILRDETGRKIMRNFVPPNVLTKLNDLSALKDGKFRLGDLLKMRTDVANDIAQGEAIPGMSTHYLSKIRDMLTETITGELDKLPDPSLKRLWQTTNDNYAKGVKPFQKSGIAELFREESQGNYLGNNEIVDRAMAGGGGKDTFMAYKEFYGANSPEFAGLKRAVADRVLGASKNNLTGFTDATSFLKNLSDLSTQSPAVAKEVFGSKAGQLMNIARAVIAGDSGEFVTGSAWKNRLQGTIKADDLRQMVASGEPTAEKLAALVSKEKALGKLYRNDVLRKVGTGEFTGDKINPSEFVNYFSTQAEPKEIQQVVSLLSDKPDVLQQIKSETVQDILNRASPEARAVDNPAILRAQPRELSATRLQNALGDATQRQRYQAILGSETYRDLEEITKFLAPKEMKERAFSTAGALSAGMKIAALEKGKIFTFLDTATRNFVMATLYTAPVLKKWLLNSQFSREDSSKAANYLIQSTPFVEAVYKQFGKRGEEVMAEIKSSVDRATATPSAQPQAPSDEQRREQFRQLLQQQ